MTNKFVLAKKFLEKKQDDSLLVLVDELDSYIKLDGTSFFIWEILKVPIYSSDIVKAVIKEFEVEEGLAQQDVEAFIDDLLKKDLVKKINN